MVYRLFFIIFTFIFLQGCSSSKSDKVTILFPPSDLETEEVLFGEGEPGVQLTWSEVPGAVSYNLYWQIDEPGVSKESNVIEGVESPYIHEEVKIERNHYYSITVLNSKGESELSGEVMEVPTLFVEQAPAAPGKITLDSPVTSIILSWEEINHAESYNLYWSITEGVTPETGEKIEAIGSPYLFEETLEMGQVYYFVLTAVNIKGESPPSPESSIEANLVPPPDEVQAANQKNSILISWIEPEDSGVSFNIYWGIREGLTKENGNLIEDVATPFIHEMNFFELPPDTVYYYVVTRVNDMGESNPSVEVSTTPKILVPPSYIAVSGTGTGIKVTWSDASLARSYTIYFDATSDLSIASDAKVVEDVKSPYTIEGLQPGVRYDIAITTLNAFGESVKSQIVSSNPDYIPLPGGILISKQHTGLTMNWVAMESADSYNLYWQNSPGVKKHLANKVENVEPGYHLNTGFVMNRSYYIVITAVNGNGESDESPESSTTLNSIHRLSEFTQLTQSPEPRSLSLINDLLFFVLKYSPADEYDLYRTDATAEGTFIMQIGGMSGNDIFQKLHDAGDGSIFFMARDKVHGFELWWSSGAKASTYIVKDINPGIRPSNPFGFKTVGGVTYFKALTVELGEELWRTDGTEAGTQLVRDINPGEGSSSSDDGRPHGFAALNDEIVIFFADSGDTGTELWRSDGTEAGTYMLKDIFPGKNSSFPQFGTLYEVVNGIFYFVANDDVHGFELWRSDGTEPGTYMVKDINPGENASSIKELIGMGGTLYFRASDGTGGELWKSDGTEDGTVMVADIYKGSGGSLLTNLMVLGDKFFFLADDGVVVSNGREHGFDLWVSDGTTEGTYRFLDASPDVSGVPPYDLALVGKSMLFRVANLFGGFDLWSTDGTADRTFKIMENFAGGSDMFKFYPAQKLTYFVVFDFQGWEINVIVP